MSVRLHHVATYADTTAALERQVAALTAALAEARGEVADWRAAHDALADVLAESGRELGRQDCQLAYLRSLLAAECATTARLRARPAHLTVRRPVTGWEL